jgi:hypothetical protein
LTVHEVDPLSDRRWVELTDRCDRSSLFHTRPWLVALRGTYGYEPVVFTDAGPDEPLRNAVLFCRVNSWLTGARLVSLPFSDHCEPLVEAREQLGPLLMAVKARVGSACAYIELRPLERPVAVEGLHESQLFWTHSIDLRPELPTIFGRFHKSHTQRAIRKAERSNVSIEAGRSDELLHDFYTLHAMTRRRHQAPIQPLEWFRNLLNVFRDQLTIYLARHQGRPIAAIVTVGHKKTLVFKYGSSDAAFHRLGATPRLFWEAVRDGKSHGCTDFDLGRSDIDNPGLIAFKEHLGGRPQRLAYYRLSLRPDDSRERFASAFGKRIYALIPRHLQVTFSSRLYKHFGCFLLICDWYCC